jgi:hypothetical protein
MGNDNIIQDVTLTLTIQSNVNYAVPINILGNVFNPLDTANATTQYQYNVTSFSITTEKSIALQYKPAGASTFSVFNTSFVGNTIQDVVNAMNTLNIGYFVAYTQSGSTYITTYNDNYVFGILNIFDPALAYLYYAFNLTDVGDAVKIVKNAITVVSDTAPSTASGSVPVVAGDSIVYDTGTGTLSGTFAVYNLTTNTYLYNQTLPPASSNVFSFTIAAGNSYYLTAIN